MNFVGHGKSKAEEEEKEALEGGWRRGGWRCPIGLGVVVGGAGCVRFSFKNSLFL